MQISPRFHIGDLVHHRSETNDEVPTLGIVVGIVIRDQHFLKYEVVWGKEVALEEHFDVELISRDAHIIGE